MSVLFRNASPRPKAFQALKLLGQRRLIFTQLDQMRVRAMNLNTGRVGRGVLDREEYLAAIPREWAHLPLRLSWRKPVFVRLPLLRSRYFGLDYADLLVFC